MNRVLQKPRNARHNVLHEHSVQISPTLEPGFADRFRALGEGIVDVRDGRRCVSIFLQ
jgi:hypothetical protein